MRLWHYKLIPYLPKSQLLAQWRELNSIFKKRDKHILINYVYEYQNIDLYVYSCIIIEEMQKRNYKIKTFENMKNFFDIKINLDYFKGYKPFKNHHTDRYLLQCFYNLQEKYDRGQKDFSKEQYDKLFDFVNELDFI